MTCGVSGMRCGCGYRGEVTTASTSPSLAAGRADPASVAGEAWFPGLRARRPVECVELPDGADRVRAGGFWVVVGEFDGPVRAWRFAEVERGAVGVRPRADTWSGPDPSTWRTSLDRDAYLAAVARVREHVRAGDVYQVNVCRVLAAPLARSQDAEPSAKALARRLAVGNPAPYAGGIHVPVGTRNLDGDPLAPVWVVSASPELFLRVAGGAVVSGPIKGTATSAAGLTSKDRAENVMIADMVRNDLQRVCLPGTVEVSDLLSVEQHPGLVHLVTTVRGTLTGTAPDWTALLEATYPPASVSGTPKASALDLIGRIEPVPRGPYTGTIGWIDADADADGGSARAELAVAIRTFWWTDADGGRLRFGTGAGITWESDPEQEWAETELKASRLIGLADGTVRV